MNFLDASALLKRYVAEPGSDFVALLARRPDRLVVSALTRVEVAAALARRARDGDITAPQVAGISARLAADLGAMQVVEARGRLLARAADLVERRPLRAYDAVQLASALLYRDEVGPSPLFVAVDDVLCKAARAEGLRVRRLG